MPTDPATSRPDLSEGQLFEIDDGYTAELWLAPSTVRRIQDAATRNPHLADGTVETFLYSTLRYVLKQVESAQSTSPGPARPEP